MCVILLISHLTVNIVHHTLAETGIKSVTLPDSLTSLGDQAFDAQVNLEPPTHPVLEHYKGYVESSEEESSEEESDGDW